LKILKIIAFLCLLFSCGKNARNITKVSENPIYEKAIIFYKKGKQDSSYFYFEKAKSLFAAKKETLGVVKCLQYMAIISTDIGDHYSSQELASETLTLLDTKNKDHFPYLQSSYSTLGMAADNLKEYKQALSFYQMALKYAKGNEYELVIENNVANAYRHLEEYNKAIDIYKKIISENKKEDSFYAQVLTNLSTAKWLRDPSYDSSFDLIKALKIREKESDLWGQHSSNSHLSEYYERKNPDSALYYAKIAYDLSKRIESPDNQLEALKKLIQMSSIVESKNYFNRYQLLLDSVSTSRNSSKNQFALIRYETEKHKADNLVLQKKNTEKNYQISMLITGTGLLGLGSWLWYRKRRQRLALEAENTIRENRLKTSKKVHDKVANNIYRVMSEVEYKDDLDKTHLLDQLEYIYNTSRDISYEITESRQNKTFSQLLSSLFFSYNSDKRLVDVVGNDEELWTEVPENTKNEISIILMELMTNMKKHSHATVVNIGFRKNQNTISINYQDNGVGLSGEVIQGNGLKNTGTRIKNISGTITFDSKERAGLRINIAFPAN